MNNKVVSEEYSMAVVEVLEILKKLPEDVVNKIPTKLQEFFEQVKSKTYMPEFDFSKRIDELELMEKTKDILAMLYRNYWCTDEEREEYDLLLNENEIKYQNELREKYSVDNLFKERSKDEKIDINSTLPVVIEKEKLYKRVWNFIKRIFRIGT